MSPQNPGQFIFGSLPRQTQCPSRAKAGRELPLQNSTSLDVECLIDGFMTDAHGWILGKVHLQALRDLLGAPGRRPTSTLPMNSPSLLPYYNRPIELDALGRCNQASEAILHIVAQGGILRQFADFWTSRSTIRMPLCSESPVVEVSSAGRRVTPRHC